MISMPGELEPAIVNGLPTDFDGTIFFSSKLFISFSLLFSPAHPFSLTKYIYIYIY
jgi:hypothetical protein